MENNQYLQEAEAVTPVKEGSTARGLIGALIASVVSAVIWAVIGILTDRVFALVGFGIGLLICFGYDLFKGKTGWIRAVIVAICVILPLLLAILQRIATGPTRPTMTKWSSFPLPASRSWLRFI